MKRIIALILIMILCLSLTACGDKQTLTNEKGEVLNIGLEDLSENGFYVHDKETDTFTPVMSACEGYDGLTLDYDPYRYLWFGTKEYDFEQLIPKVDADRYELVLYQMGESDMPENYILEKYDNLGYTVGIKFTFGDTGNKLFLSPGETCGSSMASDNISGTSGTYLPLYSINGNDKLPLNNIDTDVNLLLGLEKGKKYDFEYFDGTKLKKKTLLADTMAFKSKQLLDLDSPLKITKKGYFIIKLPMNLKPGYYYINEAGLFKYNPSDKVLKKAEAENEQTKDGDNDAEDKSSEKNSDKKTDQQ